MIASFLPEYEFRGIRSVTIHAAPARIFRALKEVTLADMPAARFLGELRYLPVRIAGKMKTTRKSPRPRIIINNRLDMGSLDDYKAQRVGPHADYATPEQRVGEFDVEKPWETCLTLGTQWSWKPDDKIKSIDECVRILVQCATGGGNLLLNVGPMPNGEIEPRQVEVLKGIGAWLSRYGESLYGSRGGPARNGAWGGMTHNGDIVYVHILKWDGESVKLPALKEKIVTSKVLTGGQAKSEQTADGIIIRMPADQQDKLDTIVKLELDRPAGAE